jgi:hypothetical protein
MIYCDGGQELRDKMDSIDDFPRYPAPHYCSNGSSCVAFINNHAQRLNALHSVDGGVFHACKNRELQRKMRRITVSGDLWAEQAQRGRLSL